MGRRNLTDEQKTYLIWKQYEAQKKIHGGDRKSSPKKEEMIGTPHGVADVIAREHGIGTNTVVRAEKFAKGVDAVETELPGANQHTKEQSGQNVRFQSDGRREVKDGTAGRIGKEYGGDRGTVRDVSGKFTASGQNDHLPNPKTRDVIAKSFGVGSKTVQRAEHFVDGLNNADKVSPSFKSAVLSNANIYDLPKQTI